MKNLLINVLVGVVLVGVILGVINLLGAVANWLMADTGRYILGMVILGYVVIKMIKKELDK